MMLLAQCLRLPITTCIPLSFLTQRPTHISIQSQEIKWLSHCSWSRQIIIINAQLWFYSHKVSYQWAAAALLNAEKIPVINYSTIYHPYIWSRVPVSVCLGYSNMLILWVCGEGVSVHGKGEKCASDVITVLISIETMLSSFYYLYKIKILCCGCLFSLQLCLANNLNEDWLVNNFFQNRKVAVMLSSIHTYIYTLGSFLPWSARKKTCIPSCYKSVNLKRRGHTNRKALYRIKSMGCY